MKFDCSNLNVNIFLQCGERKKVRKRKFDSSLTPVCSLTRAIIIIVGKS